MESVQVFINEFKNQLEKGSLQKAYRGLMNYILTLKSQLDKKYPDYYVSGSLYQGLMDASYFSFTPESIKRRNLKIVIVFNFDPFQFEVWLCGVNKQVQAKYWKVFKNNNWNSYPLVPTTKGVVSIIEHTLVAHPDFDDPDGLTRQIEQGVIQFITDVDLFLSRLEN
jgi:hypothetical protein